MAGRRNLWIFPRVAAVIGLSAASWLTIAPASSLAQDDPAPAVAPIRSETHRLEPGDQLQLDHLLDDLADARLSPDRRRRAAQILLERDWPAAVTSLKRSLVNAADPLTQRAIAQAVAASDLPDPQLIEPLFNLLTAEDAALRDDAAAALGRFDDDALAARLIAVASDGASPQPVRLGAIRALGEQRTQRALHALVKLVDLDDPAIRQAAFAALARLTGRDDIGPDPTAWKAHAARTGDLPTPRWLALLMRNLSARNAAISDQLNTRTQRLTDAYQRLYNAADEAKRPQILLEMLGDEIVAIRRLTLDLIERRVLNAQPIDDALRLAMRHHLTDASPDVRAKVALILRDLKDEPAQRQAVRLVLGETDSAVQIAYLSLMARVPSADAVDPAMLLLDHKTQRPGAASVLVAAAEAKLLSPDQAARALAAAREHLKAAARPDPALVHLLARLGDSSDEATLVKLLDHADAPVRLAAAEELARDPWSIDPLLEHLDDVTLRPVALAAAARRGDSVSALLTLLDAEPDADGRAVWQSATEAVAARLSAADVAVLDDGLIASNKPQPLHEALLIAAAAPPTNGNGTADNPPNPATPANPNPAPPSAEAVDARRLEATFRLADFYRRTNQPAKARAALTKLAERTNLSPDARRRLTLTDLRLLLGQGLVDDAGRRTRDALALDAGPSPDSLAAVWLDEADLALAADRPAAAGRLVVAVDDLLADRLGPSARSRLSDLINRIKKATPTATPLAPLDATPTRPPAVVPAPAR